VSQGEGFYLRRVAADADVARLRNGIAEAEHGIVLGRRGSAGDPATAPAAADQCDQRQGGHQQRPPPHGYCSYYVLLYLQPGMFIYIGRWLINRCCECMHSISVLARVSYDEFSQVA
jgi:hypothetical protein